MLRDPLAHLVRRLEFGNTASQRVARAAVEHVSGNRTLAFSRGAVFGAVGIAVFGAVGVTLGVHRISFRHHSSKGSA